MKGEILAILAARRDRAGLTLASDSVEWPRRRGYTTQARARIDEKLPEICDDMTEMFSTLLDYLE